MERDVLRSRCGIADALRITLLFLIIRTACIRQSVRVL
jgi:hypothetical protein